MRKLISMITIVMIVSLAFVFAGPTVREAFPEKSPGEFDAEAYVTSMQAKFNWLLSEAAPITDKNMIAISVSEEDIRQIENYKCESCSSTDISKRKVRIGLVKGVSFTLPVEDAKPTPDGGYVLTTAVESKNATALRVHFTDFNLPENAAVYVYNSDGEAFGPYVAKGPLGNGDFWSNTVSGPIAYVQLRHFGPAPTIETAPFQVGGVGHLGQKFLLPFLQNQKAVEEIARTEALCNDNEPCVEDASCFSGGAVADAKKAVAHMEWVSGAWIYYCSGGLVADTDGSSQIPYFLTANHCLSRQREADGLECYFQYWTSNCGGSCYDPVGSVPRTLGATVLSSNKAGDYTFMQLWENPPSGSVFMGWTSAPVAFSNGVQLFRISHPGGSPQAYSEHVVDTSAGTCSGWPRGNWIYSRDIVGATEGGSSGSPVYNMSGQIVGQLSGGCGTNVNDVCDTVNNATVDGAFASYFSAVEQWLDPVGGGTGSAMHVASITLSTKAKGPKTDAIAKVVIVDENGDPVEGADVFGTFSGDVSGSTSGTTGANGEATLKLTITGSINAFTFCVDNVTHATLTYDSGANVVTCANF